MGNRFRLPHHLAKLLTCKPHNPPLDRAVGMNCVVETEPLQCARVRSAAG
jgi:hypothetical protein